MGRSALWTACAAAEREASAPRTQQVRVPGAVPGPSGREPQLVEAGGQHIRGFRRGLDYAFIRMPRRHVDAERVIRLSAICAGS